MAQCEVCGNDYDKAFQVIVAGATHTFEAKVRNQLPGEFEPLFSSGTTGQLRS